MEDLKILIIMQLYLVSLTAIHRLEIMRLCDMCLTNCEHLLLNFCMCVCVCVCVCACNTFEMLVTGVSHKMLVTQTSLYLLLLNFYMSVCLCVCPTFSMLVTNVSHKMLVTQTSLYLLLLNFCMCVRMSHF